MVTARDVAETVRDPELPMLTLADLGILRDVSEVDGAVTVSITPTYTGCPAMDTMRDDLVRALRAVGFSRVEVRTVLRPAWSSDWISENGRRKLAEAGIAPPDPSGTQTSGANSSGARSSGPIPLTLSPPVRRVSCPRCGSADTEPVSHFGSTACKSLLRCHSCHEPFEHIKEI